MGVPFLKSACYTNMAYSNPRCITTGLLLVILHHNYSMVWFTSCLSTNCYETSSLPMINKNDTPGAGNNILCTQAQLRKFYCITVYMVIHNYSTYIYVLCVYMM